MHLDTSVSGTVLPDDVVHFLPEADVRVSQFVRNSPIRATGFVPSTSLCGAVLQFDNVAVYSPLEETDVGKAATVVSTDVSFAIRELHSVSAIDCSNRMRAASHRVVRTAAASRCERRGPDFAFHEVRFGSMIPRDAPALVKI